MALALTHLYSETGYCLPPHFFLPVPVLANQSRRKTWRQELITPPVRSRHLLRSAREHASKLGSGPPRLSRRAFNLTPTSGCRVVGSTITVLDRSNVMVVGAGRQPHPDYNPDRVIALARCVLERVEPLPGWVFYL